MFGRLVAEGWRELWVIGLEHVAHRARAEPLTDVESADLRGDVVVGVPAVVRAVGMPAIEGLGVDREGGASPSVERGKRRVLARGCSWLGWMRPFLDQRPRPSYAYTRGRGSYRRTWSLTRRRGCWCDGASRRAEPHLTEQAVDGLGPIGGLPSDRGIARRCA